MRSSKLLLKLLLCAWLISTFVNCSKPGDENSPPGPTDPPGPPDPPAAYTGDWKLDSAFQPTGSFITHAAVQSDGRIIIANPNGIGRITKAGAQDMSFAVSAVTGGEILAIALQTDGKVVVGGSFTSFNSQPKKCLVRLNPDGTLDNSFNVENRFTGAIKCLFIQSTGKIIAGGLYNYDYGHPSYRHSGLVRVNPDGSYDPSFILDRRPTPGSAAAAGNDIYCIKPLPGDKMYITGKVINLYDNDFNGYQVVARLNADGIAEPGFKWTNGNLTYSSSGVDIGLVVGANVVDVQSDGKVLLGGKYNFLAGSTHYGLTRTTSAGALDPSFRKTWYGIVSAICVLPDNSFFIGRLGNPDRPFNDITGISLLKNNGDSSSAYQLRYPKAGDIYNIVKESDNSILVMGKLSDGTPNTRGIARILKK